MWKRKQKKILEESSRMENKFSRVVGGCVGVTLLAKFEIYEARLYSNNIFSSLDSPRKSFLLWRKTEKRGGKINKESRALRKYFPHETLYLITFSLINGIFIPFRSSSESIENLNKFLIFFSFFENFAIQICNVIQMIWNELSLHLMYIGENVYVVKLMLFLNAIKTLALLMFPLKVFFFNLFH